MRKLILIVPLVFITLILLSCQRSTIRDPIRAALDDLPPPPRIQGGKEIVGSWWTPEDRKNVFMYISKNGEMIIQNQGAPRIYYCSISGHIINVYARDEDGPGIWEVPIRMLDKNRFVVVGDENFPFDGSAQWRRVILQPKLSSWAE